MRARKGALIKSRTEFARQRYEDFEIETLTSAGSERVSLVRWCRRRVSPKVGFAARDLDRRFISESDVDVATAHCESVYCSFQGVFDVLSR